MAEATGRCSWCGFEHLEDGWILAGWVAGPMQKGVFGDPKWLGRRRHDVMAARCTRCSHLELFAPPRG
jgi:hypothetical protein